jgi:serine/threonine protein kinase
MEFFADSPFIARLIGYCKEPLCLVVKYYPSGSLDSYILKHTTTNNRLKTYCCKQIAQGLSLMHGRQVAHCDVKPQNILVDNEPRLTFVVTDFGISKILTVEYMASEAFQIRNLRGLTVPYASPDAMKRFRMKVAGNAAEEKAGDVYSFGCVVYFMLTRQSPWQ